MQNPYDQNAPKKPSNLSINSDLLKKSKSLNINLSATLERALTDILVKQTEQQWRQENKKAIQAYNEFIEENGCYSDEFRGFYCHNLAFIKTLVKTSKNLPLHCRCAEPRHF